LDSGNPEAFNGFVLSLPKTKENIHMRHWPRHAIALSNINVSLDVTHYSLAEIYQLFRGTGCLHLYFCTLSCY
jgi:hypothetical protein